MLAADPAAWAALVTLVALEVVLGIDNLIFIAIVTNKLPEDQRTLARRVGIGLALVLRLLLLGTVAFIVQLTQPVFTLFGHGFSWRDLILIAGGLFLVWKATKEIHHRVDPDPAPDLFDRKSASLGLAAALGQIVVLDLVFSIDSIITAVGMTRDIPIMVIAVVVAVIAMMVAATPLSNFISANPDRGDAGARLPADDRHGADRRRLRRARAQGLHLRGHGLLGGSRGAQHARPPRQAQSATAGRQWLLANAALVPQPRRLCFRFGCG